MREVSPGGILSIGVVMVSWGGKLVRVALAEEVSVGVVAVHIGSETSNSGGGNAPSWPATPVSAQTEKNKTNKQTHSCMRHSALGLNE